MRILISGGTGLIGSRLSQALLADGHQIVILTRSQSKPSQDPNITYQIWDAQTPQGWEHLINEVDAVVNLVGESLSKWPWTDKQKQRFKDSRIKPGQALAHAILSAKKPPRVLIQASGINHYGTTGESAIESTSAGDDFLARLTIDWEASTQPVETIGVRRAIIRTSVVLARENIILRLMALPALLFVGGRLGSGQQALPWIHIEDQVNAIRFLLENDQAQGAFNLVAPEPSSSDEFLRTLAAVVRRPYWFSVPAWLMKIVLGEMSTLVLDGRYAIPQKLLDLGFQFQFATARAALQNLFPGKNAV